MKGKSWNRTLCKTWKTTITLEKTITIPQFNSRMLSNYQPGWCSQDKFSPYPP